MKNKKHIFLLITNVSIIVITFQTTKSIRCFGEARLDRHRFAPSDDEFHAVATDDGVGGGGARQESRRRFRLVSL